MTTNIKLGVTLYSFTNEWIAGRYDLESLLAKVADLGLGPGVELIGFSTIRSFPDVDADFVRLWRGLLDKYGLVPSSLGSNTDIGMRRDRFLTDEESIDYISRQITTAHELGFPVMRTQIGNSEEAMAEITRRAERAGVKLGMEVHAPNSGVSEEVRRVIALYDRIGSDHLGFIPDFSSTMHSVPGGMLDLYRTAGVPEAAIARLVEIWRTDGPPQERYRTWADEARANGVADSAIHRVQIGFSMFGHEPVSSWRTIADRVFHVHGKFFEIDEATGEEPNMDVAALMALLVDLDYDGFISSEWEGHGFRSLDEVDSFELVRRHQALERRGIEAAVAAKGARA